MSPQKKVEKTRKRKAGAEQNLPASASSETAFPSKPLFFPSLPDWHAWLEKHHENHLELWVGFYKKKSGKPSISWSESVDGALCFGWIDGVRKSIDESSYVIRFTPRRPRSVWSSINIKRVGELTELGLMRTPGMQAFEKRTGDRSEIYAYEQRKGAKLSGAYEKEFRAHKKAWAFFQAQPPWYQRTASWWVISAKKEETRVKRLAQLIKDSAHERTIRELRRAGVKN
jgi:uncharacterized protein YdeI (YjbR/CyaY-like superfamily)